MTTPPSDSLKETSYAPIVVRSAESVDQAIINCSFCKSIESHYSFEIEIDDVVEGESWTLATYICLICGKNTVKKFNDN